MTKPNVSTASIPKKNIQKRAKLRITKAVSNVIKRGSINQDKVPNENISQNGEKTIPDVELKFGNMTEANAWKAMLHRTAFCHPVRFSDEFYASLARQVDDHLAISYAIQNGSIYANVRKQYNLLNKGDISSQEALEKAFIECMDMFSYI
jgi:hypothetical protein